MLNSLKIHKFRGVPSLSIEDFGRVNILVGENGAGKTSVLEAIFFVANPTAPVVVAYLGAWRDLSPVSLENNDAAADLFYQCDLSKGPEFNFDVDGVKQRLHVMALVDAGGEAALPQTSSSALPNAPILHGLKFDFYPQPGDSHKSELILKSLLANPQMGFQPSVDKMYTGMGCFYLGARTSASIHDIANGLTRLYENKQAERFLGIIRAVDPRIIRIQPGLRGNAPIVLVDVGMPVMLPVGLLGDGLCRLTMMATGVFSPFHAILAIDEIDSGLHASVMAEVWKALGNQAVSESKQIFCTTHSEEMLSLAIDAFTDVPDILRVFRIDRSEDGQVKATKYTYDELRRADLASLDIR